MKEMSLHDDTQLKIFLNEVRVGMTPGISKAGPRIYGYKISDDSARYVMDDFVKGDSTVGAILLKEYIEQFHPDVNHPVYKKLRQAMRQFWLTTQGYHGDLHTSNIAVVFKPGGAVVRVMIFDYGAHKRVKVPLKPDMTFANVTRIIKKNFTRSTKKRRGATSYYPTFGPSTKLYYPKMGQSRRVNTNVLGIYGVTTGGHGLQGGIAAQGIDGAHALDRTTGPQQGQQLVRGPGVAVFTKDAQALHSFFGTALEQGQAQVAFGRQIGLGSINLQVVEGIAKQLLR
jgi:hypothetical protein